MTRMRAFAVVFGIVMVFAACGEAQPEVDPVSQVPADQRPEPTEAGGSEGAGGEGGGGATWVAVDIDFAEAPAELPAGEVEITLVNEGAAVHNVTIEGVDPAPVVEAQGGATETGTVTLEPGTYTYICSVPGHESAMTGELTVS